MEISTEYRTLQEDTGMVIRWLGRIDYGAALSMQERFVADRAAPAGSEMRDELWLLEHEPVFTIGRTPDQSSLRNRETLPAPVVVVGRGGQATWHGPGQLVGYPLLDLRKRGSDLHRHLRSIERMLVQVCKSFGVVATSQDGLTGIWAGKRKLASIGVGVRRWISMHGFALNVAGELEGFAHITPCGIRGVEMTSLVREGAPAGTTVESVAVRTAAVFADTLRIW